MIRRFLRWCIQPLGFLLAAILLALVGAELVRVAAPSWIVVGLSWCTVGLVLAAIRAAYGEQHA